MDLGLQGKSVVITGGGSNIGRAIVLAFAAEKANITIGDIDPRQAEKVAAQALKMGAAGVQTIGVDVTDFGQVQRLFKGVVEKFGSADILVNNVGWDKIQLFTETTPEFWAKVIQVNYVSVLNCSRAALEYMIPAKSGAIVSISSDASRQGEVREAVYAGTKAAVNSFMKSIARENGRYGIRCNVVCPGLTIPESQEDIGERSLWSAPDAMFDQETREKIAKGYPLRKLGRPDDIARAVVFLSSSAAGHVTGQVLSVSGGYSMVG